MIKFFPQTPHKPTLQSVPGTLPDTQQAKTQMLNKTNILKVHSPRLNQRANHYPKCRLLGRKCKGRCWARCQMHDHLVIYLMHATARPQDPRSHQQQPWMLSELENEFCSLTQALGTEPAWASTYWLLNKRLLTGWVSKDPTLICLLSCVGNFSSSTSLTAALPRNKSMVMPGGSNPWCCCHFSA